MSETKVKIKSAVLHTAIWLGLSLMFIGALLTRSGVSILPLLLVCSLVFYANAHHLMPRYLFKNRYLAYAIGVVATIVVIMGLMYLLMPQPDYVDQPTQQPIIVIWLLPLVGIFFFSTVFGYMHRDKTSRKREIDLTHQNIEFEMKFLKSQINPHFLFNALNNIYALSVIKSELAPSMILKLSEMLRFTLYDSESKKVKVGREIDYIVNFIEFQKLKMDSEPNIKIDTTNCNSELLIEPMLLIPFVENSFKHGNIANVKKGWITIEIKTLGPMLIFKVKNSLPAITLNKDVVGGIGVENVRKRLDILYPERYELNIETTDNAFSVYLKIDTFVNY